MPADDIQEVLIGRFRIHITLSVLKHADQQHKIIIRIQPRFNVLKVSDTDRHVPALPVPVRIDHASFFGKVHAGHMPRALSQCPRNRAAARADL